MARDAGKTVGEGDPEVSEAVDFARYYAESIPRIAEMEGDGARFTPYGTVAVVPPWNFPLAIPAGGVLAALAAGNAVILKPAPETVATAWALAEACWRGGVARELLQFVPCPDDEAGRRLITHQGVDAVILTGAWDTARMFLGWRPELRLHAETSGKNAIVVTATADLDEAIADLVRSRLRPRRPEVLGGQPRHRRGVGLRRSRLPAPARRRRPVAAAGAGPGPAHARSARSSGRRRDPSTTPSTVWSRGRAGWSARPWSMATPACGHRG